MMICINGKFLSSKNAKISAMDNGFLYGDGVYETMRTYEGVIFELPVHLKRLQKSMRALGLRMVWPISKVEEWAKKIVKLNRAKSARVRITLSRGENGLDFKSCKKPTLVIHTEKLTVKPEIYKKGMSAVTMKLSRILPEVKTVGLTHMIQAYRAMNPAKISEAIICDKKNFVREGASSNVFVVMRGVIWTPKNNILVGTTRNRVIELAENLGLKVKIADFKIDFLNKAEEIFLTNRPREIMPLVNLNKKKVGDGKVGEITKKLMQAYKNYVKTYIKTHHY